MTVHVSVERANALPALAWVLRREGNRVDISVGAGVRIAETYIYEGGYAVTPGPELARPDGIYLGSGVTWANDRLTIIAPSHALEGVWVVQDKDASWASNSLFLLVAATDPDGFDIIASREAVESHTLGLSSARREIHRTPDVRVLRYTNALVALGDGDPVEVQQRQAPMFDSYDTYVRHLQRVIRDTLQSSGLTECVSFLSRGYDSPACAALAKGVAPTTTLGVSRSADGDDDCGAPIAKALGLPFQEIPRRTRKLAAVDVGNGISRAQTIEPDEYADVCEFFTGFSLIDEYVGTGAGHLAGRVALGGWRGGLLWCCDASPWQDHSSTRPSNGGGSGLGEFRLRTNFVLIPVATIAFNQAAVVREIGLSDELAPWRVGGDYDRPVPRRIVEEAGVPRHLFGTKKIHASIHVASLHNIARTLFDMQVARYRPAMEGWRGTRRPVGLADAST